MYTGKINLRPRTYLFDLPKFAKAISVKRRQDKLSHKRLGARLGMSFSTIYAIENGRVAEIAVSTLVPLLVYLNRPITDFIYQNPEAVKITEEKEVDADA